LRGAITFTDESLREKQVPAVVEQDPGLRVDQARPERVVDTLDQRNRVALVVRGGDADGVNARYRRRFTTHAAGLGKAA
jgi:hypothetical protein